MPKWWPLTLKVPMPRVIRVPEWPPHDWRAWAALLSGIVGGAVLTGVAAWMIHIFAFSDRWTVATESQRIAILGRGFYIVLAGVVAVLMSQGLAINRRKISISHRTGIQIEGGGGPAGEAIDKAAAAASTLPEGASSDQRKDGGNVRTD